MLMSSHEHEHEHIHYRQPILIPAMQGLHQSTHLALTGEVLLTFATATNPLAIAVSRRDAESIVQSINMALAIKRTNTDPSEN